MKKLKAPILLLTLAFLATSCFNDIDDNQTSTGSINDFIWKGMNSWYNWQLQVPDLADTKDDDAIAYEDYLNQFDTPRALFNSLRYQYGFTDRFSWFVDDYIALQQQFQGITKSFGLRFQSVQINANGDVVFYISYVANNSPASAANIKRGDLINAINGIILNANNYNDVAENLSNDTVTLSFVTENNGTLTPVENKTISSVILSDNPIHFVKIFDDINGKKVGYLVYTGFRTAYNDELNEVFSEFKNENIDELIIDLRYNGGGAVATSAYLSSMIYADAGTGIFANLEFNEKHPNKNSSYMFQNTLNVYDFNDKKTGEQSINRLNTIDRLYILTSNNTASASEMVINGLKPYVPTLKLVGTTTYGKNVGSITLFDSPATDYQQQSSANPTHTIAMQPIVFQIFNKNGESDYTQGFAPDIEVIEPESWNNILEFGNENEVVLKAALDDIRGVAAKAILSKPPFYKAFEIKSLSKTFENEMYIENDFFNK
jgi:C-terminal processing protease CtpA/Prc